ncbi:MAG: glycosyltransferase family 4 protein [Nitrospirota bacterium]|nr:glycosyltransferase family 4 protein [Nitrospirota bacterium]
MVAPSDLQIIYPFSETLPLKKARAIQYLKTCHALAEAGIRVHAIFGKDPSLSDTDCLAWYGLKPHPNLTLWRLPILRKKEGGRGISWNGLFNIFCIRKIRSLVKAGVPSVLFLRHLKLAHHLVKKGIVNDIPTIFEAHEVFSTTTERTGSRQKLREMEASVFGAARMVVSISQGLKAGLQREFQLKSDLPVIPDGADIPRSAAVRKPEEGNICYTGHLYPWKGVDTLVKAMAHLPDARLTIVGGEAGDIQRLRSLGTELKVEARIHFEGWVAPEKVAGYLERAQVAVVPLGTDVIASHFTSPLKLFEYMAAGVPVVASDLPSVREVLTDGVNAVLVRPDDPKALAEGVQKLLADRSLANRLATRALDDVRQYSWSSRAEKIRLVAGSILG